MLRRKLLQALPINLLGAYGIHLLLQSREEMFFLDGLLHLLLMTVGMGLFVYGVWQDLQPLPLPWFQQYLPTLSAGGWLLVLGVGWFIISAPGRTPNAFAIYADGGFNGEGIRFKTDGTYEYHNGSGLGESYRYGRYTRQHDLIQLTPDREDKIKPKSNRLLIRPYRRGLSPAFDRESHVYYLDSSGRVYSPQFTDAFRVVEVAGLR